MKYFVIFNGRRIEFETEARAQDFVNTFGGAFGKVLPPAEPRECDRYDSVRTAPTVEQKINNRLKREKLNRVQDSEELRWANV